MTEFFCHLEETPASGCRALIGPVPCSKSTLFSFFFCGSITDSGSTSWVGSGKKGGTKIKLACMKATKFRVNVRLKFKYLQTVSQSANHTGLSSHLLKGSVYIYGRKQQCERVLKHVCGCASVCI